MSYGRMADDCATCYAFIYLVVVIIIRVVDDDAPSLSHGYELCCRSSDGDGGGCARENLTMHIFSINDARQIAFVGAPSRPPSPPLLSNLVTLMPEIDDISPGQASRSPPALMTSS